jgi:hypothetical protein
LGRRQTASISLEKGFWIRDSNTFFEMQREIKKFEYGCKPPMAKRVSHINKL